MNRPHRQGYVLIMTLALLVMAATMLVAVGRAAISRSLAASLVQERLQRKWGVTTCQNVLLPHAEQILKQLEVDTAQVTPLAEATLRLGDQDFLLKLSDEQAKANINSMLLEHTLSDTENRIRNVLGGMGLINAVRLRPIDDDAPSSPQDISNPPQLVRAFGQLMDRVPPGRLSGVVGPSPIRSITLWGSGAVNLLRADASSLQLALTPAISRVEIDRLLMARNRIMSGISSPEASPSAARQVQAGAVGHLLAEAQIDPKTASRLTVTDHSACHSLWIIVKDRQRVWYNFTVSDESMPQHPRRDNFIW